MNRFQEELDFLYSHCEIYPFEEDTFGMAIWDRKNKAKDTLQELINQQADYMSYQDLKAEYEAELQLYKMVFEQYASQIRWTSYCGKKKCDISQTGACDKEENINCIDCIKQKILNKARKELEYRKNLGNSIFVDYNVSEDCQNEDSDSVCLKCGKCGRMFDENGILIERK